MTLLIIDGNNIAHRVRHVFSLTGPDGIDVSVSYGFLHNLRALLNKFHPTAVIVAWDGGIPRFRRERVPSYKANRSHDDDDGTYHDFLSQLIELTTLSLPATGVLNVRRPGMEADDIIYHAAFMALQMYDEIIVVSGDEDMYQVVMMNDVYVYHPGKKRIIDRDYVEKECGVPYTDYVHWRALQGDSSDNIQGVPGIGPVRATKLFQEYNSLSGIFNAAWDEKISGKLGESIRNFGMERLISNVYVSALYADKTGARLAIVEDLEYYQSPNIKVLKDYMFSKAFISLMEPDFYKAVSVLRCPDLNVNIRTPVICEHRFPIED